MAAENSIGKIIAIDGAAKAVGIDGKERVLSLKADIFMNDRVVTSTGAKLQIKFNDDTVISQGEKSEMTIDQYVYNPRDHKEGVCSVKMMKGVFRTITGKITELNPERFKVKTNLATIGIRGCELGFRLQGNREDVYVINLPRGHSIIIEKIVADEAAKGGVLSTADRIMKVINDGVAVTISVSAGLVERTLSPAESGQLIRDSTPSQAADKSDAALPVTGSQMKDKSDSVITLVEDRKFVEQKVEPPAPVVEEKPVVKEDKKKDDEFVQPTTPPYVEPPPAPPPVLVGGAPFTSWEWGIWASGTVQYKPNTAFDYEFLPAAEYQSIIAATASRTLSGFGDAGAAINGPDGYRNQITGIGGVSLDVLIGNAVTPAWGGSFTLSGGGDSLTFSVDIGLNGGLIGADGTLSLNPAVPLSTYSLTVGGIPYDAASLGTSAVEGKLIKAGPPAVPDIVGAAGSFTFQHPTPGIRVNGAFGADLF